MQQQLHSDTLNVLINHAGAELCSITDKSGLEYIWQADEAVWSRHAPVLFPIVGRLKDNVFGFNQQNYALGQHGFARDMEFRLVESGTDACSLELQANEATRSLYPFDFMLRIGYRLRANTLTCSYAVTNPAKEPLFFSIGGHPGFNCPLQAAGERFEDYYLEFESAPLYYTELENGLRTGRKHLLPLNGQKLFLTKQLFDKDALVFEQGQVHRISLRSLVSARAITMSCEGWPYFGIWSKKGNDRFICLEPWHGVADPVNAGGELNKKEGILCLQAGKTFHCSYAITLA